MGLRELFARRRHAHQPGLPPEELQRLAERVSHLESVLEGLQDAVHRESVRHDQRIAELERKTQPEELTKALSADARRRGL